jgi:lipooligosaccharide transport system permease protein
VTSQSVAVPVRTVPSLPSGGRFAHRLVQRNLVTGRRQWLLIVSGFFEPVFFLLGLGIGVGKLVGDVSYGGELVAYRDFVAPALLATAAMNGAIYESTINVFAKLKWGRVYEAVLATPLGVRDVALGELTYALMRGAVYAVGFVVVMAALGLATTPWVALAVPASLLIGAAFAAVGLVAVTVMRSWADFGFLEVVTLPLFLFSATFVPLDEYPQAIQWLLPVTPLYHGVELLRGLTLGEPGPGLLVHVTYLVAMAAVGLAVADRRLVRLLLK